MSRASKSGARSRARELIVQTLYQRQITGHDLVELLRQFHDRPDYERVDQAYYDEALKAICGLTDEIEQGIDKVADRPLSQLDPVEPLPANAHAVDHELNHAFERALGIGAARIGVGHLRPQLVASQTYTDSMGGRPAVSSTARNH